MEAVGNWALHRESMFHELQNRIRDVRQGSDDLLYVLTENDGALLKMEPWAAPGPGRQVMFVLRPISAPAAAMRPRAGTAGRRQLSGVNGKYRQRFGE